MDCDVDVDVGQDDALSAANTCAPLTDRYAALWTAATVPPLSPATLSLENQSILANVVTTLEEVRT